MIKHTNEFATAIVDDSRKMYAHAVFDLYDPDMVVESVTVNNNNKYSKYKQTVTRGGDETVQKIGTLERDRWLLDGSWEIAPDDPEDTKGQYGWWTQMLSDDDGNFNFGDGVGTTIVGSYVIDVSGTFPYIEQIISNVEVLQGVTMQFSKYEWNGYPVDFVVEVYAGDQLGARKEYTGNTERKVIFEDFVVNFPTRLRLTIKRWSRSSRRVRVIRFLAGFYEEWDGDTIKNIDIHTESTFSGLSLPYSTCSIEVYNEDYRFDPYAPGSLFRSIEARQAVPTKFGVRLPDGFVDWVPTGTYFQQNEGWTLNDLTVKWDLVDVIGMLVNRRFVMPDTLPTTYGAWIEAIMASLGTNFRKYYIVDSDVQSIALTAKKEDILGMFCGEILRNACMATNTWPHQDYATGKLRISKIARTEGNAFTLDNMPSYAIMSENTAVSDITFTLDNDTSGNAQYVTFPGTNTECDQSLSVTNPFIHTTADAQNAYASCMYEYGGKAFSVTSRGNPSSETGDIMSIATQFGTQISARLKKQQLRLDVGVMRSVTSELIQSPNDSVYTHKIVLTGAGEWTAEDGVTHVKITLIQGGTGGTGGGGGVMTGASESGYDTKGGDAGAGGKVFITEIDVNPNQELPYSCGTGGIGGEGGSAYNDGKAGTEGGETTFSLYTSENGTRYDNGVMDVATGTVYAAPGSKTNGQYGSGGKGGKFGENGLSKESKSGGTYVVKRPKPGERGEDGKPGCIIVEW